MATFSTLTRPIIIRTSPKTPTSPRARGRSQKATAATLARSTSREDGTPCAQCAEKPLSKTQAQVVIGSPNDPLEREADKFAERVIAARDAELSSTTSAGPDMIRRKCSACSNSAVTPDEDLDGVQRKATDADSAPGTRPAFASRLHRAIAEGGRPLDPATRSFMEARIGVGLAAVRVHTGTRSAELAREIKSRAFTLRHDVFFGAGEYRPTERSGQKLLAHEVAHVLQQDARRGGTLRRKPIASGELETAIATRVPAPDAANDDVLQAPEFWKCQISEGEVSATPRMGSFYQLKPGESLLDVVTGAVQPVTPEQQLALAQVINDHPCNARFHTQGGAEARLFHGTVISSEPRFDDSAEAQGASLDGGSGGRCAIIWIPTQTFTDGSNLQNSTGFEVPRIDSATSTLIDEGCLVYRSSGLITNFTPVLEAAWRAARIQIRKAYAAVPRSDLGGPAPPENSRNALNKAFGLSKDLQAPMDIVWLREIRAKLSAMNSLMEAGNLRLECEPGDGSRSGACLEDRNRGAIAEPGRIILCMATMRGALIARDCQGLARMLIHEVAHYTLRTGDHLGNTPGNVMRPHDRRTTLVNAESFRLYVTEVNGRVTLPSPKLESKKPMPKTPERELPD